MSVISDVCGHVYSGLASGCDCQKTNELLRLLMSSALPYSLDTKSFSSWNDLNWMLCECHYLAFGINRMKRGAYMVLWPAWLSCYIHTFLFLSESETVLYSNHFYSFIYRSEGGLLLHTERHAVSTKHGGSWGVISAFGPGRQEGSPQWYRVGITGGHPFIRYNDNLAWSSAKSLPQIWCIFTIFIPLIYIN